MKVLIVHDRIEVSSIITSLLISLNISFDHIYVAEDGVTARKYLSTELFDLAIFDLTIPHMKGRSVCYTVIDDLLAELFDTDQMIMPGDLIGLTLDLDALNKIDNNIGPHLMAVVVQDQDGNWENQLSNRIQYAKKASVARQRSLNQHYVYDVAIITALDKELTPYRSLFELKDVPYSSFIQEFMFRDYNKKLRRGIVHAIGRAGQASAASATQAIITQYRPKVAIMTGFCGGFTQKVKIGDVIISESISDWDSGKWSGECQGAMFHPRPEPLSIRGTYAHNVARKLINTQQQYAPLILSSAINKKITELNVTLGATSSGSSVVAHRDVIGKIRDANENLIGVDMEGFGFTYACQHTPVVKPQSIVIKTVADYCDQTKNNDFHDECCVLSSNVAKIIIENLWDF